jgi:hypothetical protein
MLTSKLIFSGSPQLVKRNIEKDDQIVVGGSQHNIIPEKQDTCTFF